MRDRGRNRGWQPGADCGPEMGELLRRARGEWGRHEHRGHGWGPGGPGGPGGFGGRSGPPPWLAALFGGPEPDVGRGPKVRRGDVRTAILDVLRQADPGDDGAGDPINGYQVIQQIAERSGGGWRPSPGSVYPTIQQLQDEGLVEGDEERGRRALRLTAVGRRWVVDHEDEIDRMWAPFDREDEAVAADGGGAPVDLKQELGQVMPAIWQILKQGSPAQRRAALEILADTRRRLYGVLADGPEGPDGPAEDDGVGYDDGKTT